MSTITEVRKPQVGDVIYSTFGYDATFVRFFEVLKVSGTSVTLVERQGGVVDQSMNIEHVTATDTRIGEPFRRKVKDYNTFWSVRIRDCEYASDFARGAHMQTAPGWY